MALRRFRLRHLLRTFAGLALAGLCMSLQAAEPTPAQRLADAERQYEAATRAGDPRQVEAALRAVLAVDRTPRALNNLGLFISDRGDFTDAAALLQEAIDKATPDVRGFYQANLALNLRRQFRDREAEALLNAALQDAADYRGSRQGWRATNLSRAQALAHLQLSRIHERRGRMAEAVAAARQAETFARQALQQVPPQATDLERRQTARDLANALRRQAYAHLWDADGAAADDAVRRWAVVVREQSLDPETRAQMLEAAAAIQLAGRQPALAERHARDALAVYRQLGYADVHLASVTNREWLLQSLWVRERFSDALDELVQLDKAAQEAGNPAAVERVRLPFTRGLVYLGAGRHAEAAALFAERADKLLATAGEGSAQHAQALGLQGLALWRGGEPAQRVRAAELLSRSVAVLSASPHAHAPDHTGLNDRIREMIVSGHLDALQNDRASSALDALALFDWARGNPTQRAVADAAARSSIPDPLLREVIREQQDARREAEALRRFAAGEDERSNANTWFDETGPVVQRRLRELDLLQRAADEKLRRQFPDHAALVAPKLPKASDVGALLEEGEALLALHPLRNETLAWYIPARGTPHFLRLEIGVAQIDALVQRLRNSLDLALNDGRTRPFDRAASRELYRRLLQPLEGDLSGVRQLVVSASGSLTYLPLGVLLTADANGADAQAPWLARRFGITQAPGVGGWIAARTLRRQAPAPEPLLAWGDPQFDRAASVPVKLTRSARDLQVSRSAAPAALDQPASRGALRYAAIPPLPETRDELQAIANALKSDPARDLILGPQATRESVLEANRSGALAKKRVLAFATHGLLPGDLPGLSQPALALSSTPGAEADPLAPVLKLDDVLGLRLNADWVVLSACNSASADGKAEEALSGLARGFFYAGTRSLLVTHWAVESDSAGLLTAWTFEHHATNPQAPKAESLRQAMLRVMAMPKYGHPAYWAPYAVVGDGGR